MGGAGLAQFIARYCTEDGKYGIGPHLEERYNGANIWSMRPSDMAKRFHY